MDEFAAVVIGICIVLASFIGLAVWDNQKSEVHHIQCIQAVHDKPAIEINLICGNK